MQFDVGDSVMAKWPGSKLFYIAKIQLVRAEDNEYDVEYENGSVFTIPAKDTYKQNSVSFRKAVHSNRSKSKSRARSKGRAQRTKKKVDPGDESSADESLPVEEEAPKKASNSSRVSRKSAVAMPVASPKASNSSKVSGRDPKASNSSRVSSRSKRVSNTSLTSNKATTDAFSEDDDDLGMLSVSARASRSSMIAPENESELELLATDQTQLNEQAELAPNATPARASISSRISSLIFDTFSPTPDPAPVDAPDQAASLDAVSEDEDESVPQTAPSRPSASSKKASVSSRISALIFGDSASPKSPSTSSKKEEAVEETNAETSSKRASASSGTSTTEEYDTLVLRNRTVTETLAPVSELGQDDKENDAAESSAAPALTEDEEDIGPSPVSARASASSRKASASSRKASASSRKASVSSRVSIASKKASTSSKISQKEEELIESPEEEAPADVTEEMESNDKTSNVDKASISSRISNILFGGTPKASTSSKVSESNGTQPEKIIEDIAAAEVSSFPFISTRRSSRASTRASTIASNASVRQSASPNRSAGLDEFSEDDEKPDPTTGGEPEPATEEKPESTPGSPWSVEWVWAIFFMLLCPAILVSLHTICTGHVCNLAVPRLSIDPR